MEKQILLYIYLKHRKRVFATFELFNEKQISQFVEKLNDSNNVVEFGELIFMKGEFSHAVIKRK